MIEEITAFIRTSVEKYNYRGAVLGISGGIDSTVVGAIAVRALGADKVLGVILPERDSEKTTVRDAKSVVEFLNIDHKTIRITGVLRRMGIYALVPPALFVPQKIKERYAGKRFRREANQKGNRDAYLSDLAGPENDSLRAGAAYYRAKHRVRTCFLYLEAEKRGYAVLGTTNKTELRTGLFVKWGDDSRDIEPVMHLYKTEVLRIAERLGIPQQVLNKKPSPDLIPGITDEIALGIEYADLDRILSKIEEGRPLTDEMPAKVKRVKSLLENAKYRSVKSLHM
jgi:NAD+ synthase